MITRTSIIVVGLLAALAGIVSNVNFHWGFVVGILALVPKSLFSQRNVVLFIGVGLIGLRWFLVHRKRMDKEHKLLDKVSR